MHFCLIAVSPFILRSPPLAFTTDDSVIHILHYFVHISQNIHTELQKVSINSNITVKCYILGSVKQTKSMHQCIKAKNNFGMENKLNPMNALKLLHKTITNNTTF